MNSAIPSFRSPALTLRPKPARLRLWARGRSVTKPSRTANPPTCPGPPSTRSTHPTRDIALHPRGTPRRSTPANQGPPTPVRRSSGCRAAGTTRNDAGGRGFSTLPRTPRSEAIALPVRSCVTDIGREVHAASSFAAGTAVRGRPSVRRTQSGPRATWRRIATPGSTRQGERRERAARGGRPARQPRCRRRSRGHRWQGRRRRARRT